MYIRSTLNGLSIFHAHIENAMCVFVSVYICVCNYRKRGHEFDRKLDGTQKELEFGERGVGML